MNKLMRYFSPSLIFFALLALSALFIPRPDYEFAWDDTFYAYKNLEINRAFWSLDFQSFIDSIINNPKSQILSLLALPFGPVDFGPDIFTYSLLGLALLSLVLFTLNILLLKELYTANLLILVTSLSLWLNQAIFQVKGMLLSDLLLGFVTLATILVTISFREQNKNSIIPETIRPILLYSLVTIGFLTKLTYGYFFLMIILGEVYYFIRGSRPTYLKPRAILTSLPIVLFGIFIFILSFEKMWAHALNFSFGELAEYYSHKGSYLSFWKTLINQSGKQFLLVFLGFIPFAFKFKGEISRKNWYYFAILGTYLLLCSLSRNSDPRFLIPFYITTPFLLSTLFPNKELEKFIGKNIIGSFIALFIFLSVTVRAPHIEKFSEFRSDILKLHQTYKINDTLLVTITDTPNLNGEMVILAGLDLKKKAVNMKFQSVRYDFIHKRSQIETIQKINESHFIAVEVPIPDQPEFTNKYSSQLYLLVKKYFKKAGQNKTLSLEYYYNDFENLIPKINQSLI